MWSPQRVLILVLKAVILMGPDILPFWLTFWLPFGLTFGLAFGASAAEEMPTRQTETNKSKIAVNQVLLILFSFLAYDRYFFGKSVH